VVALKNVINSLNKFHSPEIAERPEFRVTNSN